MARRKSEPAVERPKAARPTSAKNARRSGAAFGTLVRGLVSLPEPKEPAPPEAASAPEARRGRAPAEVKPPDSTSLASAIEEVDAESALKLWLLARAGAEARDIAAVTASVTWSTKDSESARQALRDAGAALRDNLRRGEAIACATGFDLDLPVARWADELGRDLEARAWLSFGKQLASSRPGDWQCVTVVEPRARQQLTGIFLRMPDHQWWSFRRQLDRPSASSVDRERKRGRPAGIADESLASIATRPCLTGGPALSRALRAIRARLGVADQTAE